MILCASASNRDGTVMHDHIGITQELNDFRNDAFQPVNDFLGQTDKAKISNTYKFDVYHQIEEFRSSLESGLIADQQQSVALRDIQRRAKVEPHFPDDPPSFRKQKMWANNARQFPQGRAEWEARNAIKVEEFENARDEDERTLTDRAKAEAKKTWTDKYASQLDVAGMDTFINTMRQHNQAATAQAAARAGSHLNWISSDKLINAFDLYDRNDPIQGEAMRGQAVSCFFGMEGTPDTEKLLTNWANAAHIDRKNLFQRAMLRNQNHLEEEAKKAYGEINTLVSGMTLQSSMPSTSWQKATKGLVDAMKKTDSALDEWMRNQDQSKNYLNPKHIANVEARFFYLISNITRSVTRAGMGSALEKKVLVGANMLMQACVGDLAEELEYNNLSANIDKKKWADIEQRYKTAEAQAQANADRKTAQKKRAFRRANLMKQNLQYAAVDLITDAQLKVKLQLAQRAKQLGMGSLQASLEASAQQHQNYKDAAEALKKNNPNRRVPDVPSPTNNYHQVRLGAVIAGLETLSLISKIGEANEKGWDLLKWELIASTCSLGSVLLDMVYAFTKSVRELPKYAMIPGVDKGADIVRGGFKLAAGLFAAVAGGITVSLDYGKTKTEKDPMMIVLLWMKVFSGGGNLIFGSLAAYSYAGPFLTRCAEKTGRAARLSQFFGKAAKWSDALKLRVGLLRAVAWLGWVGLAITIADLAYAGYRAYMDATAVQRWFGRCVFRKNRSNAPYKDLKEELKEFAKAQHPGQEVEESETDTHKVNHSKLQVVWA